MTTAGAAAEGKPAAQEAPQGVAGLLHRAYDNMKSGNLGVLPIVIGLIFIVVFFSFKATNFFTATNFVNIIIQMAGTAMLAYGVVFVLLLGEIDLSISYVAGIGALTVAELQLPGSGHEINGLLAMLCAVAICAAIGAGQGSIVAYVGVYDRRQTTQQEVVAAITAGTPTRVSGIAGTGAAPV